MKQRALRVIGVLAAAIVAAPALSHDCRVRDVAGYLRGGGYEGVFVDGKLASLKNPADCPATQGPLQC